MHLAIRGMERTERREDRSGLKPEAVVRAKASSRTRRFLRASARGRSPTLKTAVHRLSNRPKTPEHASRSNLPLSESAASARGAAEGRRPCGKGSRDRRPIRLKPELLIEESHSPARRTSVVAAPRSERSRPPSGGRERNGAAGRAARPSAPIRSARDAGDAPLAERWPEIRGHPVDPPNRGSDRDPRDRHGEPRQARGSVFNATVTGHWRGWIKDHRHLLAAIVLSFLAGLLLQRWFIAGEGPPEPAVRSGGQQMAVPPAQAGRGPLKQPETLRTSPPPTPEPLRRYEPPAAVPYYQGPEFGAARDPRGLYPDWQQGGMRRDGAGQAWYPGSDANAWRGAGPRDRATPPDYGAGSGQRYNPWATDRHGTGGRHW